MAILYFSGLEDAERKRIEEAAKGFATLIEVENEQIVLYTEAAASSAKQRHEMFMAIGSCIDAWARVEGELFPMFRDVLGANPVVADELLEEARSFGARLTMVDRAMTFKLADSIHLGDWNLLCTRTRTLSHRRNSIAHAMMLNVGGKEYVLAPFFKALTKEKWLYIYDVKESAHLFSELASCLDWFQRIVIDPPLPAPLHYGDEGTPPKLLLRLREERAAADRRRSERQMRNAGGASSSPAQK